MTPHYKQKIIIFSNYDWTIYKFRKNLIKQLSTKYEIIIITKKSEKDFLKDFKYQKIYENYNIYNYNIFKNIFLLIKIFLIYKKSNHIFVFILQINQILSVVLLLVIYLLIISIILPGWIRDFK